MARLEAALEAIKQRQPGVRARRMMDAAEQRLGHVPAGMRLRAGLPGFLEATAPMDRFFRGPRHLPPRIFRLAMLKAAALTGCPF